MDEEYIQVGFTAMRDPDTGGFLPAVPLYIKNEGNAAEARDKMFEDFGKLLAQRIRLYKEGCREAGEAV